MRNLVNNCLGDPPFPNDERPIRPVQPPIPLGIFKGSEGVIPKGGWRSLFPVRDIYRDNSGRHHFEFEFHPGTAGYDIDIISMPEYPASLQTDFHRTHRLSSRHGNDTRICFGDESEVSTLEKAKQWAGVWAEHTVALIENGTRFPNN